MKLLRLTLETKLAERHQKPRQASERCYCGRLSGSDRGKGEAQRRNNEYSATGLIQMGARPYSPELGAFISEDPVLGHVGIGISSNRYPYAWDNPLNLYDLDGRDVCVPTPFGDACAGEAAEDAGNAASETWHTGSYIVTHPGDAATNAVEYWANSSSPAANVFGPLATTGDMILNPDRAAYYLEKVDPAQAAATGIAAAGTVGIAGVTVIATGACFAATPELEALHACTGIGAVGWGVASAGGIVTVKVAER